MLSHFSCARLFATLWTVAHQAPLSMGFSREECWSGSPCPPAGNLLDPGIETASPATPALQVDSLPWSHLGRSPHGCVKGQNTAEWKPRFTVFKAQHFRWLGGKKLTCQCRRCGLDPWVRKIPWRRKWNLLHYSSLENPMDRGAWQATVRGVAKSQTQLRD